jgi:hypothetical protein
MYDQNGQCGCDQTPVVTVKVVREKKPKPAPKVARGFKTLKGTLVGTVIADAVNQVTLIAKDGKSYFVIEAEVIGGIPVMKCKQHKTVKYKRPVTTAGKHAINKFGN